MNASLGRILIVAAGAAILASSALAMTVIGGPGDQRLARMDLRRTHDLQRIESEIERYAERHGRLPADLAELAAQPGVALGIADPQTAMPYRYLPGAAGRYRLCAGFDTDSGQRDAARRSDSEVDDEWRHPRGEFCFDGDASGSMEEGDASDSVEESDASDATQE
ncbi:hypothetical protein [Lysobacter enzymogenes]|uniref:hypothetical protein n=1 Tax=Lysobacter enzymogenes TaxID=69 RepID=UPI001AF31308|nr:hypothetical protein [Lysobacter enzymogenes]QQP99303.1 hypothetical protein JHW41_14330 [Lysobacter enzymogenes]